MAAETFCLNVSHPFFILGESKETGPRDEVLGSGSLKPALISACACETKARHLPQLLWPVTSGCEVLLVWGLNASLSASPSEGDGETKRTLSFPAASIF